jgi:hypothetical protein
MSCCDLPPLRRGRSQQLGWASPGGGVDPAVDPPVNPTQVSGIGREIGLRPAHTEGVMHATESLRLPSSPLVTFLRWWLPAIVCVAGVALAAANGFNDDSLEGASALIGAGLSIWLMNILWRIGISGDSERDDEQAAREYFDAHGRWPDDKPAT